MKKVIVLFLLISSILLGQADDQSFGISFSGFVKTDFIYDTRQSVTIREGHFLLYPQNKQTDINGLDINDKASFNILSIQTRLNGKIKGPNALGAKTSGVIEGEFFGHSESDINGFRLRHAFVKLDWSNTALLIGQTWHPLFNTEMFPGVVSFNTGVPFQPFSRNPQVRITHTIDQFKVVFAALSQRDLSSNGPNGFSSSYLRNSVVPNLHAQIQFESKGTLLGAGVDYKKLTPRLLTVKNMKTDNSISSFSYTGFMKLTVDQLTFKLQGVYGSNLADQLMLGGYAIKSIDTITGFEDYTTLKCLSFWGELVYGKEIEVALFAGYTKNLGAENNIAGSYFGRGTDIENVFRISPRVQFSSGKTKISTELEYTSAGYGVPNNLNKGKVENVTTFSNLRLIAAVFYFF